MRSRSAWSLRRASSNRFCVREVKSRAHSGLHQIEVAGEGERMGVGGWTDLDDSVRGCCDLGLLSGDGGFEIADLLVEQLLTLGDLDGFFVFRVSDGTFLVVGGSLGGLRVVRSRKEQQRQLVVPAALDATSKGGDDSPRRHHHHLRRPRRLPRLRLRPSLRAP